MARDRMLRKSFWDSLTIGRLSLGARLLFQCMWNFSDDEGRSKGWDPEYWRGQAFRFDDPPQTLESVQSMMDEITKAKLVVVYEVRGETYTQVRSWHEHQTINHPTPSRIPPPQDDAGSTTGGLPEQSRPKEKKRKEKNILSGLDLYEDDNKLCSEIDSLMETWTEAYPGVDIMAEIRKAHAWEMSNPAKRKKDRKRFLNSWLSRSVSKESADDERDPFMAGL